MKYRGGFDYSCGEASFAVADEDGKIVFESIIPTSRTEASLLPSKVETALQEHSLDFSDVAEWSIGAGPGSFTGLRIASAFVMGLAFGKESVRLRCVSTSSAIAVAAGFVPAEGESVLTLFDGRKNELLVFEVAGRVPEDGGRAFFADGEFKGVIRTSDDIPPVFKNFAAMPKDLEAVKKVLGDDFAAKVRTAEHVSASALIFADEKNFSRPPTELVYLRPPVFVEPRKLRSDV